MTELAKDAAALNAANLLIHYSFDLGGYTVEELVGRWLQHYPASWLRTAVIEALYQGRYKAISVAQILMLWHRRGQPLCHFNHEFERIICGFPRTDSEATDRYNPESGRLPEFIPDFEELPPADTLPTALQTDQNVEVEIKPGELPIQPFKPALLPMSNPSPQEIWLKSEIPRQPIHQFIPVAEAPDFYVKLKAGSQTDESVNLIS